jgi:desulfoferrodoxin (superoxide reductase-like protein)
MADLTRASDTQELLPRRVFVVGFGAVGAVFLVPGCGNSPPAKEPAAAANAPAAAAPEAKTDAPAASAITANPDWEAEAKTLEAGGQGLYTAKEQKDQPGKEGSHVPKVALTGTKVALTTTHPTEAPSDKKPKGHHITHHYLRDTKSGLIFAWKTFDLKPGETAASEFTLPEGVTSFTAYQVCNLHWTWASEPATA